MSYLSAVLEYKNKKVVEYFCHHNPELSEQEVQTLFTDLLAWIWLKVQRDQNGKKTYLFGPLLILDQLWHTFILHTRDYIYFSNQYFNTYVHHDIEPPGQEHVMEEDEISDFLQDCFTYLGSEWITRRFATALMDSI
ncbi:Uncharacterized conserved protein [Legionella wadsworthii]|uniref:Uncharacterized conserved protein n=1 Tax=Legionella wadsworthii TaxID=28088 RepID=A0A378LWL5_9GAMM|nr:hypothetical protein [Legionella wadsworthii]STY30566.1 Uncharacterized conserved protein [Legionella wadsworthii]